MVTGASPHERAHADARGDGGRGRWDGSVSRPDWNRECDSTSLPSYGLAFMVAPAAATGDEFSSAQAQQLGFRDRVTGRSERRRARERAWEPETLCRLEAAKRAGSRPLLAGAEAFPQTRRKSGRLGVRGDVVRSEMIMTARPWPGSIFNEN